MPITNLSTEDVTEIVDQYRKDPKHVELELRLGTFDETTKEFTSGISKKHFDDIFQDLSKYTGWTDVQKWHVSLDMIYDENERGIIEDEKKAPLIFNVQNIRRSTMKGKPGFLYDFRVSLKTERPVLSARDRRVLKVRLKNRQRFIWQNIWAYDFTITKIAPDLRTALENASTLPCTYEVEIEMLPQAMERFASLTSEDIANDLLRKAVAVLQRLPFSSNYIVSPIANNCV